MPHPSAQLLCGGESLFIAPKALAMQPASLYYIIEGLQIKAVFPHYIDEIEQEGPP